MSDLNKDNKFHLAITIVSANKANVGFKGINGVGPASSRYYITCWESKEIGNRPYKKQELLIDGQSGETAFDGLNLTDAPYTFSLGLDYNPDEGIPQTNEYYPVSVTTPIDPGSEDVFISENPVILDDIDNVGRTKVRVKYRIPVGNYPPEYPQYIVMIKGRMDSRFYLKKDELLINSKVESSDHEGSQTLTSVDDLIIDSVYTMAYIMGGTDTEPDLNNLVGWTEFIAQ